MPLYPPSVVSGIPGFWAATSAGGLQATDLTLIRDAANVLALRNGVNAQTYRVYNTFTDASNYERLSLGWSANVLTIGSEAAGTGTLRAINITGPNTSTISIAVTSGLIALSAGGGARVSVSSGVLLQGNTTFSSDNTYAIGATGASRPSSLFLASPAPTPGSGTGYTANNSGEVRRLTSKHTLTFAALQAAATTADFTLCTLPAKTRLVAVYADVTATFTGGAIATATLSLGKTVGGAEYLVAFDAKTATIQRGLVDGDLGTSINRANAVEGGDIPSWSATTPLSVRLTTTGANTSVSTTGSVTFYIVTEAMP